jgi:hypothetical protein
MNIEITPEMLLAQLEYSVNDSSVEQITKAINNTVNFEKFAKHIVSLNDNLKHMDGFVALSNHTEAFKIKSESQNEALIEEFHEVVSKWADKYHVSLETIPNKNVYYIIGVRK